MAGGGTKLRAYEHRLQDRQIRLARIQAARGDGLIQCYLTTAFLDQNTPPYIALSYAWGQPQRDTKIYVDDEVGYITPNLAAFIQQLCREGRNQGYYFWADAICIDQGNQDEKTQQVRMMRDIFSKCSECFCWLGPALSMDGEGIELLKTLTTKLRHQSPDFVEAKARHELIFQDLNLPPKRSIPWQGLKSIVRRPWFSRAWIIEECLLPPKVTAFLGHRNLSFDLLLQFGALSLKVAEISLAIELAATDPSLPRPPIETSANYIAIVMIKRHAVQRCSVFFLRTLTTQFFSHDPRDKVYSTVAFATHFDPNLIDYKNLTAREVFIRLTKLGLSGSLGYEGAKLLCHARGGDQPSVPGLPTWALDWNSLKYKTTLDPYFSAVNDSQLPHLSFQDSDVLHIRGKVMDPIKLVRHRPSKGRPYDVYATGEDIDREIVEYLAECERLILSLRRYPTGQPIAQVMSLAFIRGSRLPSISPAYDAHPLAFSKLFEHHWYPNNTRGSITHSKEDTDKAYALFVDLYRPLAMLSFFVTERGYVGFAHEDSKVGDILCVFQGLRLPFTVRSAGEQYQLMGDTYLHGLMDYEAHRAPEYKWEMIEIV